MMTIEEFKELIIANTLKGGFPDERWGIQFPKEAWDEDTESVDLSKAKLYWILPGQPGFGLYAGYDYIPVRDADFQFLCELLESLVENEPDDEYGQLYEENPFEAVDRYLRKIEDPLLLAGYEFNNGRLYVSPPRKISLALMWKEYPDIER